MIWLTKCYYQLPGVNAMLASADFLIELAFSVDFASLFLVNYLI